MWVWRPENGTLGVKASLKKKEPGNVTRKANGKRTKKESFLESRRGQIRSQGRSAVVGASESPGEVRAEQESFYFLAECLVVGSAAYFGQSNWSVAR